MSCTVSSLCSGEAFLNVEGASDNPQQARVGYCKIIRILDKHSHFAMPIAPTENLVREKSGSRTEAGHARN